MLLDGERGLKGARVQAGEPLLNPFGTAASHPTDHIWPLLLLCLAPGEPRKLLTGIVGP